MNFKLLIFVAALSGTSFFMHAQSSKGGMPLSLKGGRPVSDIPAHYYALPDHPDRALRWDATSGPTALRPQTLPEYAGVPVTMDISFPESGRFSTAESGQLIWQARLTIPGAPAIGLYYDRFYLPPGVQLFLRNKSGTQILGAYTYANSSAGDLLFATEAVQGDEVTLELNIATDADLSEIQLHLNRGLAYFRGIRYLEKYAGAPQAFESVGGTSDPYDWLVGQSSACMVNASCAPGSGYATQQKATIQLLLPAADGSVAYCSGTLVNSTGNADEDNCRNYVLTASHCETSGGETNAAFSQYLIRFNYTYTDCSGDSVSEVHTLTGADFVARTPWPQPVVQEGMPDFLLLQLREGVPASWDAYLSGWDRNRDMPSVLDSPKQYMIFHHPSGDVRKLTYSREVTDGLNSWSFFFPADGSQGGVAPGSSGSGLFNGEKLLVGITSVAAHSEAVCDTTGAGAAVDFYSWAACYKLSSAWERSADPKGQLKHWLDPTGSGVMQLNSRKACETPVSSVEHAPADEGLENIVVYPNPSADGTFKVRFQFDKPVAIYAEVYGVSGKRVGAYQLPAVASGIRALDLSTLVEGVYLVKFYFGGQSVSKKVIIR